MYRALRSVLIVLTFVARPLAAAGPPTTPPTPPPAAAAALSDFARACAAEHGAMWGVSLCGPMLVVDPESRWATANTADADGVLMPSGGLFVGTLPAAVGLANTAAAWGGTKWSMVLLPLPEDARARRALMLHEAWHRIQDGIGLPAQGCNNTHLENARARAWMRLEWRALGRAVAQRGPQRTTALADALRFRRHRRELFPGSAREEARLELNEGLAEYTGERIAYGADMPKVVARELAAADRREHLTRSFAYLSGPAYGALLDDLAPAWREHLSPSSDLGELAERALPPGSHDGGTIEVRGALYGLADVTRQEERLGAERKQRQSELRAALVEAPALVLPLTAMKMQFDPNRVVGLPPDGTVYLQLTAEDTWGRLEATAGALVDPGFSALALPGRIIEAHGSLVLGDTWRLELASGWRLVTSERGPATVTNAPPAPRRPR